MKEVSIYTIYLKKIATSIQTMFTKPLSSALLFPTLSLSLFTDIQTALLLLFFTFSLDFITGILASYIEHKKEPKEVKVYIIQSAKMRKSVVKAISYFVFIAFSFSFEKVFAIKAFSFLSISDKEFSITVLAVAFCVFIEFFSILENCKRSGFDIIGKAESLIKRVWKFISTVKGNQDGE